MTPLCRLAFSLGLLLLALPPGALAQEGEAVSVSLPVLEDLQPGAAVWVPVLVEGVLPTSPAIAAFQGAVAYDPAVLEFTGAIRTENALAERFASVQAHVPTPGRLRFMGARGGGGALSGGPDTLLFAEAVARGSGTTPLAFQSFQFNEGAPATRARDGSAEVTGVLVNEAGCGPSGAMPLAPSGLRCAGGVPVGVAGREAGRHLLLSFCYRRASALLSSWAQAGRACTRRRLPV